MIIANRLTDGVVVFLDTREGWDPAIAAGVAIDDETEAKRLFAVAKQHETDCKVVDPQLIEVLVEDGRRKPKEIREAIRAFGPTVRTDLIEA